MENHGKASRMPVGQFREFAGTVLRCLPDDLDPNTAQDWIDNPEALRKILWNALSPSLVSSELKVWKTIKLGTAGLKSGDDFLRALKDADVFFDNGARAALLRSSFRVAPEEIEVELVAPSVAEMGFRERGLSREIFKKAPKLGLELCPQEVGPQFALQCGDQITTGDDYCVAMDPIDVPRRNPFVFRLQRRKSDGVIVLSTMDARFPWKDRKRVVFIRRK